MKRKKVKRKDIKLLSPKSPRCNIRFKQNIKVTEQQRHQVSTNRNEYTIVSKIINTFERNPESINCFKQNDDKTIESDRKCIKEGLVRNAFDLLMLQKGVDSKSKTPEGEKCEKTRCEKDHFQPEKD